MHPPQQQRSPHHGQLDRRTPRPVLRTAEAAAVVVAAGGAAEEAAGGAAEEAAGATAVAAALTAINT